MYLFIRRLSLKSNCWSRRHPYISEEEGSAVQVGYFLSVGQVCKCLHDDLASSPAVDHIDSYISEEERSAGCRSRCLWRREPHCPAFAQRNRSIWGVMPSPCSWNVSSSRKSMLCPKFMQLCLLQSQIFILYSSQEYSPFACDQGTITGVFYVYIHM